MIRLIFVALFVVLFLIIGIPVLGIKDSKKRVIEYVLNLDTIDAEKKKEELKFEEARIRNEWTVEIRESERRIYRKDRFFISEITEASLTSLSLTPDVRI